MFNAHMNKLKIRHVVFLSCTLTKNCLEMYEYGGMGCDVELEKEIRVRVNIK